MYLEKGDAYFTTGNIEVKNELKVQGLLYVGGDANVGKLATESDAKINIQGNLLGTENQDLVVDGCILNINGKAKVNKLTIQGSAPKLYGCSFEVTGKTILNSNGAEAHINNLKTGAIDQCAGSTIIWLITALLTARELTPTQTMVTINIIQTVKVKLFFKEIMQMPSSEQQK